MNYSYIFSKDNRVCKYPDGDHVQFIFRNLLDWTFYSSTKCFYYREWQNKKGKWKYKEPCELPLEKYHIIFSKNNNIRYIDIRNTSVSFFHILTRFSLITRPWMVIKNNLYTKISNLAIYLRGKHITNKFLRDYFWMLYLKSIHKTRNGFGLSLNILSKYNFKYHEKN